MHVHPIQISVEQQAIKYASVVQPLRALPAPIDKEKNGDRFHSHLICNSSDSFGPLHLHEEQSPLARMLLVIQRPGIRQRMLRILTLVLEDPAHQIRGRYEDCILSSAQALPENGSVLLVPRIDVLVKAMAGCTKFKVVIFGI